jgi:hypothetical protein
LKIYRILFIPENEYISNVGYSGFKFDKKYPLYFNRKEECCEYIERTIMLYHELQTKGSYFANKSASEILNQLKIVEEKYELNSSILDEKSIPSLENKLKNFEFWRNQNTNKLIDKFGLSRFTDISNAMTIMFPTWNVKNYYCFACFSDPNNMTDYQKHMKQLNLARGYYKHYKHYKHYNHVYALKRKEDLIKMKMIFPDTISFLIDHSL